MKFVHHWKLITLAELTVIIYQSKYKNEKGNFYRHQKRNDLTIYQFSERGTVGRGTFDNLSEWSFFYGLNKIGDSSDSVFRGVCECCLVY